MSKRVFAVVVAGALPVAAAAQVPLGIEFRVNSYTTGSQPEAVIASSPNTGLFIVAWMSMGQDGNAPGVFARRYIDGVAQGSPFQVNTYTTSSQNYPAVAADGSGRFVVVWTSYQGISAHEIFGLFVGPGIARGHVIDREVQQTDVIGTLGGLMKVATDYTEGGTLDEVIA